MSEKVTIYAVKLDFDTKQPCLVSAEATRTAGGWRCPARMFVWGCRERIRTNEAWESSAEAWSGFAKRCTDRAAQLEKEAARLRGYAEIARARAADKVDP